MKLTLWEVFFPTTGRTFCTVPFAWMARMIANLYDLHNFGALDYGRKGEGWVN